MTKATHLLLFLLIFPMVLYAQSEITGKIISSENVKKVRLKYSEDGIFIKDKIIEVGPQSNGEYKLEYRMNTHGYAYFQIEDLRGKVESTKIYIYPKSKMIIHFDASDFDNSLRFEGDLKEENTYLKSHPLSYSYEKGSPYREIQLADTCLKKVAKAEENTLKDLLEKAKKKGFAKHFIEMTSTEIELYYAFLFNSIAADNYFYKEKKEGFEVNGWKNKWEEKILPIFKRTNPQIFKSSAYSNIISPYSNPGLWQALLLPLKEEEKTSDAYQLGTYQLRVEIKMNEILEGEILEIHYANYIRCLNLSKGFENYLIGMFDRFKGKFPNSKFLSALEKDIVLIQKFQREKNKPLSTDIHIIENYQEIHTLSDLLTQFKGKVVLIDLWGTWCSPCREEFKYNEALKTQFKDKEVEYLYISYESDGELTEKRWEGIIKFYNLKGYHLIGSKKLFKDIYKEIRTITQEEVEALTGEDHENAKLVGRGFMVFPAYLIINQKGEMAFKWANNPSSKEKLYEQINQVLASED